ncbi:6513_t:CDS:2, partial [Ambispora leptoticha]
KPELFLPSIIIWGIQVAINTVMVLVIVIYIMRPTEEELEKMRNEFNAEKKKQLDMQIDNAKANYIEETDNTSISDVMSLNVPDVPNQEDSGQSLNEITNELSENEKILKTIGQDLVNTENISLIIKDIFEDGKLFNDSDKISSDIQSKIIDKRSEILHNISIKISKKFYVNTILSAEISPEIQLKTLEKEPKKLQLTTKINLLKKIKYPMIEKIIFAEIHIDAAIMSLKELFNNLLER